jgi:hypothetical protein
MVAPRFQLTAEGRTLPNGCMPSDVQSANIGVESIVIRVMATRPAWSLKGIHDAFTWIANYIEQNVNPDRAESAMAFRMIIPHLPSIVDDIVQMGYIEMVNG